MNMRRMVGWQPIATENTEVKTGPVTGHESAIADTSPVEQTVVSQQSTGSSASAVVYEESPVQESRSVGVLQDPDVPRRRMAGWQPVVVAQESLLLPATESPNSEGADDHRASTKAPSEPVTPVAPTPVNENLKSRRMGGWEPLKVGQPAPVVSTAKPARTDPAEKPVATEPEIEKPAPRRMGAPASGNAAPKRMAAPVASAVAETQVTRPEEKTPAPTATVEPTTEKTSMSKTAKVLLTLVGVTVVAAGLVLGAERLRTLDPVAQFIAAHDGIPAHPDGVEPGIPGWVGWQHFFNFLIMVMVIRSGLLIRNQERPEAYWTANEGGFYSPIKKNTPSKVSIQQWIHQSFNVLWVLNGLVFYIMVFATGRWMRIVPTHWDIFPNMVSAGVQYLSSDWPPDNAWIHYNALQVMAYFVTVFIAGPVAVLTGLRMSTWWPQRAESINKAFPLPIARTIHFVTMLYFVLFIIVHLFLVFTTGALHNLNMMFTARDAADWIGILVFAVSIAVTAGVGWLIKPIFISPIAEKSGTVSAR